MTSATWGATPAEWQAFCELGLTEDLLPVVSNPKAVISPKSKMKDLGKTPSRYNRERQAAGIPGWTDNCTTDREVAAWLRDSDLGICLQTRRVRAIDIDIPDPEVARKIRDCVEMLVGALPLRHRRDSGKCLLAFRLEGSYTKRILRTAHGPIEFLANGQQFIAVGTHPKGARYEWEGGIPTDIPYLTAAEFEALWVALEAEFAIEATTMRAPGTKPSALRKVEGIADDVLTFLERTGWVRSMDNQGRAHIICPFEDTHSDGGGSESSTTYFPRGVGGFEQGHFRCLHAHCEHLTDGDFLEAVGYVSEDFEVIVPEPGDTEAPLLLPSFERNAQGAILATVGNLQLALRRADVCQVHIGYDAFNDETMVAPWKTADWRSFTDADYTRLRIRLESGGFKPIGRELVRDVVGLVAEENRFDSAQLWLSKLVWDGVPRVKHYWSSYFRAEDNAYTRSCGEYTWSAMAGRVLDPGVKADMVPILVGEQGVRKTSGVEAMVPDARHFVEIKFDDNETEMARRMRGKLIGEIGELRGLHSREIEHIKAWITRTHEEWVPKFKEFSTKFPRRLVFIGTTNQDEFLADETGNRRWLPIRVGLGGFVDIDAIKADRDQLWAEAVVLFREHGVMFKDAQQLAEGVHNDHTLTDPWDEMVHQWLESYDFPVAGEAKKHRDTVFQSSHVLKSGVGLSAEKVTRGDEMRMTRILKRMGFVTTRARVEGRQARVWKLAKNNVFVEHAENNEFEDLA